MSNMRERISSLILETGGSMEVVAGVLCIVDEEVARLTEERDEMPDMRSELEALVKEWYVIAADYSVVEEGERYSQAADELCAILAKYPEPAVDMGIDNDRLDDPAIYSGLQCDLPTGRPVVTTNTKSYAAPELYKAVKEYLEWGPMTGSDRDLHDKAFRAAIAKAEGKS